jgi:hypothetical protein
MDDQDLTRRSAREAFDLEADLADPDQQAGEAGG